MNNPISGNDLKAWRQWAKQEAIKIEIAPDEVDWLLQALTRLDRLALRLGSFPSQIALPYSLAQLTALWQRRLSDRVPVQYLVGETPWRKFSLKVTPAVLIPRPETEYIIDLAIAAIKASKTSDLAQGHWADLGTGSGAIAIGLAASLPEATIHAVDSSPEALAVAQENTVCCGFDERIHFYLGSWWNPLTVLKGRLSGMISNPPYIPSTLILDLQPEVALHEPHNALDGGVDGLDEIRTLVNTSPDYLCSGGIWLIEMMTGQGDAIAKLLHDQGQYENIQIINDLTGRDRFVLAYRR